MAHLVALQQPSSSSSSSSSSRSASGSPPATTTTNAKKRKRSPDKRGDKEDEDDVLGLHTGRGSIDDPMDRERVPTWRSTVPLSFTDVKPNQVYLSMNWLLDQGWIIDCFDDSPAKAEVRRSYGWNGQDRTLTLWSGGNAWFPQEQWPTFLKYMAFDLKADRVPLYYNQIVQTQPYVRFAMDMDFEGPARETDADLRRYMDVILGVLGRYYPGQATELVVLRTTTVRIDPMAMARRCLASRKTRSVRQLRSMNGGQPVADSQWVLDRVHADAPKHDLVAVVATESAAAATAPSPGGAGGGGGDYVERYKTGLHPVGNFFVRRSDLLQLAHSCTAALARDLGERKDGYNSWAKVIDVSPLEKGTLRMVGSIKRSRCFICSTYPEFRLTCPGCHASGKINDSRPYTLWSVVSVEGGDDSKRWIDTERLDELKSDTYAMVMRTSLHALPTEPDHQPRAFVVPPNEPRLPDTVVSRSQRVRYTDGTTADVTSVEFSRDAESIRAEFKGGVKTMIHERDPRFRVVEALIQRHTHVNYRDLCVRSVMMTGPASSPVYTAFVVGHGQHYCQNRGEDHRSNTVYFRVGKEGGQKGQPARCTIKQRCHDRDDCRDYTSRPYDVTDRFVMDTLFPPVITKKYAASAEAMALSSRPSMTTPESVQSLIHDAHQTRDGQVHDKAEAAAKILAIHEHANLPGWAR